MARAAFSTTITTRLERADLRLRARRVGEPTLTSGTTWRQPRPQPNPNPPEPALSLPAVINLAGDGSPRRDVAHGAAGSFVGVLARRRLPREPEPRVACSAARVRSALARQCPHCAGLFALPAARTQGYNVGVWCVGIVEIS